jgi:hypothetical protein
MRALMLTTGATVGSAGGEVLAAELGAGFSTLALHPAIGRRHAASSNDAQWFSLTSNGLAMM